MSLRSPHFRRECAVLHAPTIPGRPARIRKGVPERLGRRRLWQQTAAQIFSSARSGIFGLAVRDPRQSANWYVKNLGFREEFVYDEGTAVGSDGVTIALFRGAPRPETINHRAALAHLLQNGVSVEDPGDEVGLEAPGSPHVGIWFRDPDGYRLELFVQNGAKPAKT